VMMPNASLRNAESSSRRTGRRSPTPNLKCNCQAHDVSRLLVFSESAELYTSAYTRTMVVPRRGGTPK
jgi:hypothetical protein